MPLGSRICIAVAVLVAAGLALPGAAGACSTDEYLTAEERESGLYDTTPPDYYAGSSAPHTHDEGGAPAEAPAGAVKDRKPAEARAPKKRSTGTAAPAPVADSGQTPQPAAAPASGATAPDVAATAPVVAAHSPVAANVAAAKARARHRAARARAKARARAARQAARREARALARAQAFVAARTDGPRLQVETGAPEVVAAAPAAARDDDGSFWAWAMLLALLAAAGVGAMLRRRPTAPQAVLALDPPIDPVEAELQEMLAQELARDEDDGTRAPAVR